MFYLFKLFKIACPGRCTTCLNLTVCLSCIGIQNSSGSRLSNLTCFCPTYFFYDNYPYQIDCQNCSFNTCLTCDNSSNCSSCLTTINTNISLLLPNCTCPVSYFSYAIQPNNCSGKILFL